MEQAGSTSKTEYFGGRIYESGHLKEIAHEEGRILATTTGFEYHYYLCDHLGNVRVEFKEDADGEATITQENHYYPFGMRFSGEVFANNDNDFRYNGKELQDDFGLDWPRFQRDCLTLGIGEPWRSQSQASGEYDYGARFYDPALGRWHAVDPLADKAPGWTPYRYGFNNPMSFIDPDGRAELQTIDAHLINKDEDEDPVWITQSVTDKKGRTIISRTVKKGEGETATGSNDGEGDEGESEGDEDASKESGFCGQCHNPASPLYNDPSLVKARQDALLIELSTIFIGGGSIIKGVTKISYKAFNSLDDLPKMFKYKRLTDVSDDLIKSGWRKLEGNFGSRTIFEKQVGSKKFYAQWETNPVHSTTKQPVSYWKLTYGRVNATAKHTRRVPSSSTSNFKP